MSAEQYYFIAASIFMLGGMAGCLFSGRVYMRGLRDGHREGRTVGIAIGKAEGAAKVRREIHDELALKAVARAINQPANICII